MSDSYVDDQRRKQWSRHVLVRLPDCTGTFQAFMLRDPDYSRLGGCLIVFTPEGIVICGDHCPRDNQGVVSAYGYGLGWFAGHLGESYLCSKFLRKVYLPSKARWYIADRVKELAGEEDRRDDLDILQDALNNDDGEDTDGQHFGTMERFADLLSETDDWDALTDGVANGYDLDDAALLCVIQQRFAETYKQLERTNQDASCQDRRAGACTSDPGVRGKCHMGM